MTSVLYDVPGPKAILRNRILGVATIVVVAALLAFLVWRLIETGQFSERKWMAFTYTNVWMNIFAAVGRTLLAFVVAAIGALIVGFVLAIGRLSDHAWVRIPVTAVIEFLRAVPVLVFMFLLYYGLPVLDVKMEKFWAVVIALVLYNGSVLAEVLRAGVESVPRGQKEAGFAIGLRKSGVMRMVLLPQAIRAMMPVIIAQLVVTLKDTALGFIITYEELLFYARYLGSQSEFGSPLIPSTMIIGTIYIVLCLALSYVAYVVEKRSRRKIRELRADAAGTGGNPALKHDGTETEVISLQARGKLDGTST